MAIVLPKFSRRRPSTGPASETQPAVRLWLCSDEAVYESGTALTARWRIARVPVDEIQSLEVSVLWHTEGKGDEDLHVHHFHRVSEHQMRRARGSEGGSEGGSEDGTLQEHSIECVLPATPLSYHGRLIRICWCVRLRLYLTGGREIVTEQPFYLVSANRHAPCAASLSAAPGATDDEASDQVGMPTSGNTPQLVGHAARL